jgi:CRISPR system Cascade subunit CasB
MNGPTAHERAFTDYLAALLAREDRAALAALRRGLGKRPGEAAEMFPYVMPWITSEHSVRRQDDYFLVASLFAEHQIGWAAAPGERGGTDIGASFWRLRQEVDSGSIERRFVALLNAERADLPNHLRHAIALLKTKSIPVDWPQLLHDLGGWDWESRSVQRDWAQSFWRDAPSQSAKTI